MKNENYSNDEQKILIGYLKMLKNDGFTPKTAIQLSNITVEKMINIYNEEKSK